MNATSRDEGLVRKVGPWGLAASVLGIVVGAGIFAVPGALAAAVGPYAPLAFLFCGLAIGAVAICFAEGGSRMPTSGGVYGYIEAAFGPLTGYVAGILLLVGDVLACGGVAAALADVAASAASKSLVPTVHAAVLALTGSFAELAASAALTTAALYALGCVAAWLLARRGVAVAGAPLNFRWLGAATLVGVTSMLALIALGSWLEVVGLATLIGLSALIYLGGRRASLYPS